MSDNKFSGNWALDDSVLGPQTDRQIDNIQYVLWVWETCNNQSTGDNTVFVVCRFRLWRWCLCCVCGWESPFRSCSLDITLASVSRWLLELCMFLLLLHLLLLSIVVCLTFDEYSTWLSWWYAHVTMILLCWLIIMMIWCLVCFIVDSLYVLTTHVTVCECRAELKRYLLLTVTTVTFEQVKSALSVSLSVALWTSGPCQPDRAPCPRSTMVSQSFHLVSIGSSLSIAMLYSVLSRTVTRCLALCLYTSMRCILS